MARLAFVTDELPRPGLAGHLALNHAILSWLVREGHEVTVLLSGCRLGWLWVGYRDFTVAGPWVHRFGKFLIPSVRRWATVAMKAVSRLLPAHWRRRIRKPVADAVLGSFVAAGDVDWLASHAHVFDALLVDTVFRTPLLQHQLVARLPGIVVTHDVFHRRHAALCSAGYTVSPPVLSRETEAALLAPARAIAAMQPEEAAVLREMCPGRAVVTIGMPAVPNARQPEVRRQPGRLVFVGSASLPNLDGLRWFLEDVWPLLRPRRGGPAVTLDLVGACGAGLGELPPGVARLGQVRRLAPCLHRASLAIAPLRVGSGLKIKLLDYARHGLMTVATPAALEGFAEDAAAPFIRAGSAVVFAQAIATRLARPAVEDARALLYVSRHYGAEACFGGLRAVLDTPDGARTGRLGTFSGP